MWGVWGEAGGPKKHIMHKTGRGDEPDRGWGAQEGQKGREEGIEQIKVETEIVCEFARIKPFLPPPPPPLLPLFPPAYPLF